MKSLWTDVVRSLSVLVLFVQWLVMINDYQHNRIAVNDQALQWDVVECVYILCGAILYICFLSALPAYSPLNLERYKRARQWQRKLDRKIELCSQAAKAAAVREAENPHPERREPEIQVRGTVNGDSQMAIVDASAGAERAQRDDERAQKKKVKQLKKRQRKAAARLAKGISIRCVAASLSVLLLLSLYVLAYADNMITLSGQN